MASFKDKLNQVYQSAIKPAMKYRANILLQSFNYFKFK